jgi:hypothetical protein
MCIFAGVGLLAIGFLAWALIVYCRELAHLNIMTEE